MTRRLTLAAAALLTAASLARADDVPRDEARHPYGSTDLHRAASELETLDDLLTRGWDPDVRNDRGRVPLHYATSRFTVERLYRAGAELDVADLRGDAPLHALLRRRDRDAALALVELGADVRLPDGDGNSPLHLATDPDVAAALIQRGARVDARNRLGETPLHVLARDRRNARSVELLIEHGADPNATDGAGLVPLDLASRQRRLWRTQEIIEPVDELLIRHGAVPPVLEPTEAPPP